MRHEAKIAELKKFCEDHNLPVLAQRGKRPGQIVRMDYVDAVNIYLNNSDVKYKAENIMKEYGVECLRLPPYHPELSALGKYLKTLKF